MSTAPFPTIKPSQRRNVRSICSRLERSYRFHHIDWNWKHHFVKEVFGPVIKATLAAETPSYKTILELDRKIREKPFPPAFTAGNPDNDMSAETYLQSALLSQFRTLTVSYLHKSFFAQALLDHPENPLLSRYAPSFLAASNCASDIIRESVMNLEIMPR